MPLSVIIVSYNGKEYLRHCLASLVEDLAVSSRDAEIRVMDNASEDGSPEMVSRDFPEVSLTALGRNLGFAGATNEGVRQSGGEYLLLLNPDTLVLPGAVGGLLDFLEGCPEAGAAGPRLLNPDGSVQPSWGRFPDVWSEMACQTGLYRLLPAGRPVGRRMALLARAPDRPVAVDWAVGACLLTSRRVWEMVGPLEEAIFLYGEDLDWCYRLQQAGRSVWHIPQCRVIHHLGHSSDRNPAGRLLHQAEGMRRFFRLHRSPGAALTHEALLRAGALARSLYWQIKASLFSGDPAHFREMARGHAAVLRSGIGHLRQ